MDGWSCVACSTAKLEMQGVFGGLGALDFLQHFIVDFVGNGYGILVNGKLVSKTRF